MKRSDYKYFYETDFLDTTLHQALSDPINHCAGVGYTINEDGSITVTETDPVIRNRYSDDSILIPLLPEPLQEFINLAKGKMIEQGAVIPTIFNISALIKPDPDVRTTVGQWHKDYNLITNITDPNKLWFTMLSLGSNDVTSEFMVSPTSEWPNLWNIGVRTTLESNKLFGHTMNLGHQYFKKDKNDLTLLYIRWYDRG